MVKEPGWSLPYATGSIPGLSSVFTSFYSRFLHSSIHDFYILLTAGIGDSVSGAFVLPCYVKNTRHFFEPF
jgi:hypothetical protein